MVLLSPLFPVVKVRCRQFGVPIVMVLVMSVERPRVRGAFWRRARRMTEASIGQASGGGWMACDRLQAWTSSFKNSAATSIPSTPSHPCSRPRTKTLPDAISLRGGFWPRCVIHLSERGCDGSWTAMPADRAAPRSSTSLEGRPTAAAGGASSGGPKCRSPPAIAGRGPARFGAPLRGPGLCPH